MIYLVTGSPGTGKTAMVLSWIRKNTDGLFKYPMLMGIDDKGNEVYEDMPRPIFVNDIDDIDHDYFGTQDISDDEIKAGAIQNVVPTPTPDDPAIMAPVLIVDEAHRIYPVRSATAKTPEYVESLAKLRHHGVTLILITQHPTTIDKFVRDRVGKHIHIVRSKVGSKAYTFYDVQNTLTRSALQSEGMMDFYTIDKEVWSHYKSASTHVKFKKKTQKILYIFPAIIIMMVIGFSYIAMNFGSLTNFGGAVEQNASDASTVTELDRAMASNAVHANNANQSAVAIPSKSANNATVDKNLLTPEAMTPRYQEQPESKPMYDDLRKPKSFEYPVAIIESKGHCKAYSEQGTLLDIPQNFCKKWLRDGRFNPYREPNRQQEQPKQQQAQTQSNSILALSDSTKHDEMRPSIHLDAQ